MITIDEALQDWLVEVRQDLHRHPELSSCENRTTRTIESHLAASGVAVHSLPNMTGTVGLIRGAQAGPTLALRGDIDALPITELNDAAYKSINPGVMHACGHDAHTTIMLGVAKLIMDSGLNQRLNGNVKFLFQPAEETGRGARMMIEQGVLENPRVEHILAAHLTADLPGGWLGLTRGTSHSACDVFHLSITGQGGHGGRPQLTRDPIVAGAHLVTALQSIVARNLDPQEAGVISVGEFIAGSANNIIPGRAVLSGSIRAFSPEARQLLQQRLREMVDGLAQSFGVECRLELEEIFSPCVNHDEMVDLMEAAARETLGPGRIASLAPVTAAEDFGLFLEQRPGAMIRLGCAGSGPYRPLHSATFDFGPEVLFTGVRVFTEAVQHYLARTGGQRELQHQ